MATIGLDKLYYATITEDPATGEETYSKPTQLAKAISAELSVELAEAILYADDGASEIVKEFKSGTLTLGVDDLGVEAAAALTGAQVDANGVLISTSEDNTTPVAIGFRAARSNGKYQYFWLYRVKFALPTTTLATKADSITFSTPTIEGTILRRNKPDGKGRHPWKAEVTEGAAGVKPETITGWYTAVYEPANTADVGAA
ncbi:phage tail protein [Actinobaculum suis]|uniref:major tail protein n=1 Tax=Actinobaculum suis TaxID=1657 RepID=UPI00066FECDE|nr:major tail protein [Actinobaculum suis]KMY23628.1 phage tail protein [Actinobaculum suis]